MSEVEVRSIPAFEFYHPLMGEMTLLYWDTTSNIGINKNHFKVAEIM